MKKKASQTAAYSLLARTRAAIYIRWSTDDQKNGTTLEVQIQACKMYAQMKGWELTDDAIFVDEGWSGSNLERPAMRNLRAAVSEGRVNAVIVYKLDRLSRSLVDTVTLVCEEWKDRAALHSTQESYLSTEHPQGVMFLQLLAMFAENERATIKARTMSGKIARAEQGSNPGTVRPFGYMRGETAGSTVIVEDQAATVRRVYSMYLEGRGFSQIAGLLNQEATTGRTWSAGAIDRMLSNPVYTGRLMWGDTDKADAHPAIIDQETFDRAARLRAGKGRKGTGNAKAANSRHLLTGLARCGICGSALNAMQPRKNGPTYYVCTGRKLKGEAFCDSAMMREDAVAQAIHAHLLQILTPEGRDDLMMTLAADLEGEMQTRSAALIQIEIERSQLRNRAQRLQADYARGDLPARLWAQQVEQIEAIERDITERAADVQAELADLRQQNENRAEILENLDTVNLWDDMTQDERKELLQHLCYRVDVTAEKDKAPVVRVHWTRRVPTETAAD